ncbi:hypothetical protein LPC08_06095 [Roseomonas sp. OT10]|uniref:hypothetical protein n=1 Tax=Roseomonas cutis TaxID=2897332 RepID=UPI001E29F1BE|nr:hypothetical protein [Roseomonas sp. OT10]UFN50194.1 hypothetical protein LPC08_06095 [Roseomonas sp. OT10]
MAAAANEAWYRDSNCRLEAEGYQWRDASHGRGKRLATLPDPDAPKGYVFARTGGLIAKRRVLLAEDNLLYRFAARRYLGQGAPGLEPLLNSPWWMEEDRMLLLLDRARTAGSPLAEMARNQLALPVAWTDCDIIVRVRLRPGILLAAHAGPGITAQGAPGDRRVVATEAPHLFMDQLYIPGLGRLFSLGGAGQHNVTAWLDTATARAFDPNARGFNP